MAHAWPWLCIKEKVKNQAESVLFFKNKGTFQNDLKRTLRKIMMWLRFAVTLTSARCRRLHKATLSKERKETAWE